MNKKNIEVKAVRNSHHGYKNSHSELVSESTNKEYHCRQSLLDAERPQHDTEAQTGRSMVEMLGVLAIIGVLSVGGIAGYTSAMNKHRANDTVQRIMRRAVIISSQKQLGQTATLSGFNENDGAYAITLSAGEEASDPTFTLEAANVPEDVCQKLLALTWPSAALSPTNCGTTQDMSFTFKNDLSAFNASDFDGQQEACQNAGNRWCRSTNSCVTHDETCVCLDAPEPCQICNLETGDVVPNEELEGQFCDTNKVCQSGICMCEEGYSEDENGECVSACHEENLESCDEEACRSLSGDYAWENNQCWHLNEDRCINTDSSEECALFSSNDYGINYSGCAWDNDTAACRPYDPSQLCFLNSSSECTGRGETANGLMGDVSYSCKEVQGNCLAFIENMYLLNGSSGDVPLGVYGDSTCTTYSTVPYPYFQNDTCYSDGGRPGGTCPDGIYGEAVCNAHQTSGGFCHWDSDAGDCFWMPGSGECPYLYSDEGSYCSNYPECVPMPVPDSNYSYCTLQQDGILRDVYESSCNSGYSSFAWVLPRDTWDGYCVWIDTWCPKLLENEEREDVFMWGRYCLPRLANSESDVYSYLEQHLGTDNALALAGYCYENWNDGWCIPNICSYHESCELQAFTQYNYMVEGYLGVNEENCRIMARGAQEVWLSADTGSIGNYCCVNNAIALHTGEPDEACCHAQFEWNEWRDGVCCVTEASGPNGYELNGDLNPKCQD